MKAGYWAHICTPCFRQHHSQWPRSGNNLSVAIHRWMDKKMWYTHNETPLSHTMGWSPINSNNTDGTDVIIQVTMAKYKRTNVTCCHSWMESKNMMFSLQVWNMGATEAGEGRRGNGDKYAIENTNVHYISPWKDKKRGKDSILNGFTMKIKCCMFEG